MVKESKSTTLQLSTGRTFRVLLGISAGFIAIHLLLRFLFHVLEVPVPDTFIGRFDVDNEISIPTWWSQILLFVPAVLGFFAFRAARSGKRSGASWWLAFSALFLFFSADEGAMLHEAFITKFREWTTDGSATGLANHLWLIPVAVVFALLLVPFMRFMRTLPKRTAVLLAIGIGTFVFGAIAYETFGLIVFSEASAFAYQGVNVAIEEALEMTGVCTTIYGVLEYLRLKSPTSSISLLK